MCIRGKEPVLLRHPKPAAAIPRVEPSPWIRGVFSNLFCLLGVPFNITFSTKLKKRNWDWTNFAPAFEIGSSFLQWSVQLNSSIKFEALFFAKRTFFCAHWNIVLKTACVVSVGLPVNSCNTASITNVVIQCKTNIWTDLMLVWKIPHVKLFK